MNNRTLLGLSLLALSVSAGQAAMATEKLAEGIRLFARDQEKLEALLAAKA